MSNVVLCLKLIHVTKKPKRGKKMTDKEMIEALQNKLSESIAENSYLKEAVTLISNRHRRERIENKVVFAVEVEIGRASCRERV